MPQVTGIVEDKRIGPMNTQIRVLGEQYSSFKGAGLAGVEVGDTVDFLWNPDKKGQGYKNIVASTVRVVSKGTSALASSPEGPVARPATFKPYSTLGVELGHASKLAMDMALSTTLEVGSDDFYKFWVHHTNKVFDIMSKFRKAKEHPVEPPVAKAAEPILASEEESIF